MEKLLSSEETEKKLNQLDVEWAIISGVTLTRVFTFDDFAGALDFVNKIGKKAEKASHHPDIKLSWGKVVVADERAPGGAELHDPKIEIIVPVTDVPPIEIGGTSVSRTTNSIKRETNNSAEITSIKAGSLLSHQKSLVCDCSTVSSLMLAWISP